MELARRLIRLENKPQPHRCAAGVPRCRPTRVAALELRRKIPVDFQADADLDKVRGAPGHFHLLVRILPIALLLLNTDPRRGRYFELGDRAAGPLLLPGIP